MPRQRWTRKSTIKGRRRSANYTLIGQGGRPVSWRNWGLPDLNHHPSDERKGGNAYTPKSAQGRRNATSKTAGRPGTREQHSGSISVRRVTNKSSDWEPQASSKAPTSGGETTLPLWPDPDDWEELPEHRTALVDTSYRGGGQDSRTTSEGNWPTSRGSGTPSRPAGWRKLKPSSHRISWPHEDLWPPPDINAMAKHRHHGKNIDVEQLPLLWSHPGHEVIKEACAHPDLDVSEQRCRSGAGVPRRKPRREDGPAPSTKTDPPASTGTTVPVAREDPTRETRASAHATAGSPCEEDCRTSLSSEARCPKAPVKAERGK